MNKRLIAALCAYAVIAVLAAFTLDGGKLRNIVWILMAAFALRTYSSHMRTRQAPASPSESDRDEP
jgi:hypothetical protein